MIFLKALSGIRTFYILMFIITLAGGYYYLLFLDEKTEGP